MFLNDWIFSRLSEQILYMHAQMLKAILTFLKVAHTRVFNAVRFVRFQ